jgi:hypothetical protein
MFFGHSIVIQLLEKPSVVMRAKWTQTSVLTIPKMEIDENVYTKLDICVVCVYLFHRFGKKTDGIDTSRNHRYERHTPQHSGAISDESVRNLYRLILSPVSYPETCKVIW